MLHQHVSQNSVACLARKDELSSLAWVSIGLVAKRYSTLEHRSQVSIQAGGGSLICSLDSIVCIMTALDNQIIIDSLLYYTIIL